MKETYKVRQRHIFLETTVSYFAYFTVKMLCPCQLTGGSALLLVSAANQANSLAAEYIAMLIVLNYFGFHY
jgi:hypothetical protein